MSHSGLSRLPLLALGFLSLLAALWAGLVRMGWAFPPLIATLPAAHGPLMVAGFLGTLSSLERAVALKTRWIALRLAPILCALGALAAGVVAALVGLLVPPLRVLYDYAWFVGFGVAFVLYAALMRGTPQVDLSQVPQA